jgi:hypothetical protein
LCDFAHRIENYQDDEITYRLKPSDLDFNLLTKYVPEAIKNKHCYRGIGIFPDNINIDNIVGSLKSAIWTGTVDSWSEDKSYVDEIETKSLKGNFTGKLPIRMEADIKGLDIPIFWNIISTKCCGNDRKLFDSEFNGVDEIKHMLSAGIVCK